MSWSEVDFPGSFTSAWNGAWSCSTLQTVLEGTTPYSTGDLYLVSNPATGKAAMVMAELGHGSVDVPIWFKYDPTGSGNAWSSPTSPIMPATGTMGWDFPSLAVGPNGRLIAGASLINGSGNAGFQTVASTNSGSTWTSCCSVVPVDSGGALSRLVYSSSGFHLFTFLRSGTTWTVQHYLSADGTTAWSKKSDLATIAAPWQYSPVTFSGHGQTGAIDYAPNIDVSTSSKLGWVVAYQAKCNGLNCINVNTELGGSVTISYTNDLFLHGVSASDAGDWWLDYFTYSNPTSRTLPLIQAVVYRVPGSVPSYLGSTIVNSNPGIDPTSWYYYPSQFEGAHCPSAPGCFTAGAFSRPAANPYAGSSVPSIVYSTSVTTTLQQFFLVDPPGVGNNGPPVAITPFENGADLSGEGGPLSQEYLAQIAAEPSVLLSTQHVLAPTAAAAQVVP